MIKHYLKTIGREILKNPFRFLLTAIGISVGIIIFSFVYFFLFQAQGKDVNTFPQSGKIVQITAKDLQSDKEQPLTDLTAKQTEENLQSSVKAFARISSIGYPEYINVVRSPEEFLPYKPWIIRVVNQGFFDVFGTRFHQGSHEYWGNNVAVISKSFAKKVFGTNSPLDQKIELTDETKQTFGVYRIVGVMNDIYVDAMGGDVYLSNFEKTSPPLIFALLNKKTDIEPLNTQLKNIQQINEETSQPMSPQLKFIAQKTSIFNINLTIDKAIALLLALLVLISALVNYFNLLANSAFSRIRQFSLRKIVGASPSTLFCQLLFENIPLLVISLLVSLGISEILISLFIKLPFSNYPGIKLYPQEIYTIQLKTVLAILFLTCLFLLLFLQRVKKVTVTNGIRGMAINRNNKHFFRNISLGVQLLFSIFLLSSTLILFQSYNKMSKQAFTAFNKIDSKNIFAIPLLDFTLPEHQQEIIEKIKNTAQVEDILTMGAFMPVMQDGFQREIGDYSIIKTPYKLPDSTEIPINIIASDKNIFSFFKIAEANTIPKSLAPNDAIISSALMKELSKFSQTTSIDLGGGIYQIAGVAENIPFPTSSFSKNAVWIAPPFPDNIPGVYVKSKQGQEKALRESLTQIIREYVPSSIPFNTENLSENKERTQGYPSVTKIIIYFIAFFSLIVALFGIFTAITADTYKKQKNVAIRKINGAKQKDIYWLFSKTYILLLTISALISSAFIVFIWNNELMKMPVENRSNIYVSLVITIITITFFVILVMFQKLNRIAKINPAEMVKSE